MDKIINIQKMKVEKFRKEFFKIAGKLLEPVYQKEGHSTWRYAFIKKCNEIYDEKVHFSSLKQMEDGEKNITSKIYILLILEIQRNYKIDLLENLENLENLRTDD